MQVIADLHVHSKYSRATSQKLSLKGLQTAAKIKGIDIIGTGDFTHPKYLSELKEQLVSNPKYAGFFCLKGNTSMPLFILSTEISCIYSQDGTVHRNHIIITSPDFKTVDKIVSHLSKIGNLAADGRPILGLSSEELAKIVLEINPNNLVIPGHLWTPWFSTLGSKSGFDSMQKCFGAMSKYILAIETGLSSDPPMNWRVQELDNYAIVSNGDAHSSHKVGREATVFELESVNYQNLVKALKNSAKLDKSNLPLNYIKYTIEFYPEEGKYHWDGHRACDVQLSPRDTKKYQGICPKCRKPLTLGVMYRVESLANRSEKEAQKYACRFRPGFKKIVPLEETVADAIGQNTGTKRVTEIYDQLIAKGGSEFNILLNLSIDELSSITFPEIVLGIKRVRKGEIHINPGYDGVFGKIDIFTQKERERLAGAQVKLF